MQEIPARQRWWCLPLAAAGALGVLSACATYQPRPLEDQSPLVADLDVVRREMAEQPAGSTTRHEFNPIDGLDLVEVGMIAVVNNPDLRVQRARFAVAGAQVFSAGLLPDPQISAGLDKPTGHSEGLVNAWAVGLGYDIIPLITRQSRVDAERKGQEKVRLDLLWQEWQVVQHARSLAVRLRLEEQRLALLRTMRGLYQERYRRSARALAEGDTTLDVNGTDLTALVDTLSQINQLEQTHNQSWHEFNLLLGLDPAARIVIAPVSLPPALEPEVARSRLARLPELRPDLLALKAGYESQEARVRAAILGQFPSLSVGINRARDTSDVRTNGLSVNLDLPLFSGNRGNIAIERATREQLREEYRARLAQARVDVDRLLDLQAIVQEQQHNLQTYLPHLKTLVDRASRAYSRGDIDALTFLNMESTWVNKRLEQISLEQTGWENRIALEALLALPGYPETPLTTLSETRK
jgi:outer membrane protein TolC